MECENFARFLRRIRRRKMIYLEAQENLKGKSMKRRLHKNSPYKEKLLLSEGTILFSTFDGRYYGSLDKEIPQPSISFLPLMLDIMVSQTRRFHDHQYRRRIRRDIRRFLSLTRNLLISVSLGRVLS